MITHSFPVRSQVYGKLVCIDATVEIQETNDCEIKNKTCISFLSVPELKFCALSFSHTINCLNKYFSRELFIGVYNLL